VASRPGTRKWRERPNTSHFVPRAESYRRVIIALALLALILGFSALSYAQSSSSGGSSIKEDSPTGSSPDSPNQAAASLSGTVQDKDGAAIPNAKVVLTEGSFSAQSVSGGDGSFTFKNVPAGSFQLSLSASGFGNQSELGILQPGEDQVLPPVQLVVATTVEVNVTQTREEIAEQQIKVQEQQRILGVIPNYFVSYVPDAQPLNTRQKFQLGWKFVFNPFSLAIAGFTAGIEQANNSYSGYGQGAQGYAKRFGASYADFVSGTFFGSVIFPALLKQDPRYFYKGTGSKKSRFFYAVANAVICKGDNGHWQPNYSNVLGSLAAGGVSNLYYPASDRNGVALTFENTLIGLGGSAAGAVFQEFFSKKLTPHVHEKPPSP
jgi:Carboxypeptidase regulatory-like domain